MFFPHLLNRLNVKATRHEQTQVTSSYRLGMASNEQFINVKERMKW